YQRDVVTQTHLCVRRQTARETWTHTASRGGVRSAHTAAIPRPCRCAPQPRGIALARGGARQGVVRTPRESTPCGSPLRGTLGAPLDGHVALQRVVGPGQ